MSGKGHEWRKGTDFRKYRGSPYWLAKDGWRKVSFAGDCLDGDENECGSTCAVCGEDYVDCGCPGPTQDEYEYQEFNGVLYARRINQQEEIER